MVPVGLADVVDTAHVRVRDLTCEADLGEQPLHPLDVAGELGGEELEGDALREEEILGAIDLAHAPFAQHLDDAVAAAEHGARREAAPLEAGGRRRARQRRRRPGSGGGGEVRGRLAIEHRPGSGAVRAGHGGAAVGAEAARRRQAGTARGAGRQQWTSGSRG